LEEQLQELQEKLTVAEARVAELEGQLAEANIARDEAVAAREGAEARVAELESEREQSSAALTEVQDKLAAAEMRIAELAVVEAEAALKAKLNELVEGHTFAATIISEARELGVTIESAEKVVGRLKVLVEAAASAANEVPAPRGDLSTDEDVETPAETVAGSVYTAEQLKDLRDANLITEAQFQVALTKRG
jgi:chromosome segregation ATPase